MGAKNYYQIMHCSDQIFRITSQEGVYMELFVGTHHALLLDTGFGFGDLKSTVQSITSLPLIIVNTHGHLDHCNGNYQFKGYPIYMNEKDWDMCYKNYTQNQRALTVEQAQHKKIDWNKDNYIDILPQNFDADQYIHAETSDLIPLNEGKIFDLGGITLKTIEVPGHTPGSCALLHQEENVLYIGDAANSHMVLFLTSAIAPYINTLDKLQNLDFKYMRLSHEANLKVKSHIEYYIDCIKNVNTNNYVTVASLFDPNHKDYMYIRNGYTAADMNKPGFASFIISEKIV